VKGNREWGKTSVEGDDFFYKQKKPLLGGALA